MKATILIHESVTQLILKPESEHDKAVCDVLAKLPHTHRDRFYLNRAGYVTQDEPQSFGYYTSSRDRERDLVIVINHAAPAEIIAGIAEPA